MPSSESHLAPPASSSPRDAAGFTLVELMIGFVLLTAFVAIAMSAQRTVVGSLAANQSAADVDARIDETARRLQRLLQPGIAATLQTQATAADVLAGFAPAVGDWFAMPQSSPRTVFRLQSAHGPLSDAIASPLQLVTVQFALATEETANALDDDGDGLVDEGNVRVTLPTSTVDLVNGAEGCSFELEGRTLRIAMQLVLRDRDQRVLRATVAEDVYLRNP